MPSTRTTASVAAAAAAAILAASIPVLLDGGGGAGAPAVLGTRPCTDGIPAGGLATPRAGDCLCDTITAPPGSNIIACEDFEAASLFYAPVGTPGVDPQYQSADVIEGNTVYPFGPLVQNGGPRPTNRGEGSYFDNFTNGYWSNISTRCPWARDQPPGNPTIGVACQFQNCWALRVWHPGNIWDANYNADQAGGFGKTNATCGAVMQNGLFDMEVATILEPVIPGTANTGVFDGNQSWAERLPPCPSGGCTANEAATAGLHGGPQLPNPPYTDFGITYATGYSSNTEDAGLLIANAQWKHMEFSHAGDEFHDAWTFMIGSSYDSTMPPAERRQQFPFMTIISQKEFPPNAGGECGAAVGQPEMTWFNSPHTSGAFTLHKGRAYCNTGSGTELTIRPLPADYDWDRDWGLNEWGCVKIQAAGYGTSSAELRVWFNETLVIHYSGLDMRDFAAGAGGRTGTTPPPEAGLWQIKLNNFYNDNQDPTGSPGPNHTTETTYRYKDNWVVTDGEPVSCADIGFGDAPPPEPDPPAATLSGGQLEGGRL